MSNAYHVPTEILGNQAQKTSALYNLDSEANRQLLAGIGIVAEDFERIGQLGNEILNLESSQEQLKTDASIEKTELSEAVQAVLDWRAKKVLPRVKIALDGDHRLRHFRPGKLRSRRGATVVREAKLLVATILKYAEEPLLVKRGITAQLAHEGTDLIARVDREDIEAADAMIQQVNATKKLYDLEDQLDDLLANVERCAAAVFEPESAALKRYRMNEIRNYINVMHGGGGDTSTAAAILDPTGTEAV